jgi:hypothetical protein
MNSIQASISKSAADTIQTLSDALLDTWSDLRESRMHILLSNTKQETEIKEWADENGMKVRIMNHEFQRVSLSKGIILPASLKNRLNRSFEPRIKTTRLCIFPRPPISRHLASAAFLN